jgi:predicted nucleic acid-binding protein
MRSVMVTLRKGVMSPWSVIVILEFLSLGIVFVLGVYVVRGRPPWLWVVAACPVVYGLGRISGRIVSRQITRIVYRRRKRIQSELSQEAPLRLTSARICQDEASEIIDEWQAQPCSLIVHPTIRHAALMRGLLTAAGTAGNLTTDADLAALSVEYGAAVCSYDADFARFPGVRLIDPDNDL